MNSEIKNMFFYDRFDVSNPSYSSTEMVPKLNLDLPAQETQRMETHLARLISHLVPDKFAIAGGLAIQHHVRNRGYSYPNAHFNDLDIIVESPEVLLPSIGAPNSGFLIAHRHIDNEKGWHFTKLIDRESQSKADLLPYSLSAPENFQKISFQGQQINIVGIEDQLVLKAMEMQRISATTPIAPKELHTTLLLTQIADLEKAERKWQESLSPIFPFSLEDAIKRVEKLYNQDHPEWFNNKPFKHKRIADCDECIHTDDFPIATRDEVVLALGEYGPKSSRKLS